MPSRQDPGVWMWAQACELLNQAERLQRQFFMPAGNRVGTPGWEPPVDMFENDSELLVTVALPGVTPERLSVYLESGGLIVKGLRALQVDPRHALVRRLEIPYGRFERRIALPERRYQLRRQELIHGCLHLILNKL